MYEKEKVYNGIILRNNYIITTDAFFLFGEDDEVDEDYYKKIRKNTPINHNDNEKQENIFFTPFTNPFKERKRKKCVKRFKIFNNFEETFYPSKRLAANDDLELTG